MVKKRQHEIPEVAFAAPAGSPAGVEVMSLAELRSRAPAGSLARPHRPGFHHLLSVDSGALWHTVDFTGYALSEGSWLWVRPGQVQQFGDLAAAEGTLVLFQPGFLDPATAAAARLDDWFAQAVLRPVGADRTAVRGALEHLGREYAALGGLPLEVHGEMLRHLLAVLVLRIAHLTAPVGSAPAEPCGTFLRFRDAVERGFTHSRRVEDYARALGYSPRTLSRATLATAGVGAKEFIDRRVVLEARRLLAHGDQPAARIAARLGFADATNFTKFFQQRTGLTPIAFRTSVRGGG